MQKNPKQVDDLIDKKKGSYTELDFFILKMIKLNTNSPTSPYRHKTKTLPQDRSVDPFSIEKEPDQSPDIDAKLVILEKCRLARDILNELPIPDRDKEIFFWRFFADNPLRSWEGHESYSVICNTYNKVKKQMIHKIKNPHSTRRGWTMEEIRYLTNEFPHIETMGIALKLNRNYDAVRKKAQRIGLKKTTFTRKKTLRKNAPNPHE